MDVQVSEICVMYTWRSHKRTGFGGWGGGVHRQMENRAPFFKRTNKILFTNYLNGT